MSLGNSVTPFANLYLNGTGYFTGNMLFGPKDVLDAMRTTITWDGKIRANNHIQFLSDGEVMVDKRNQGFMYLGTNSISIGSGDHENVSLDSHFGRIGLYENLMELNHDNGVEVNSQEKFGVTVKRGTIRFAQNSSSQSSYGVVELAANNLYTTSSADLGTSSNRWGKLWGTNVDFNGNMVVGKINNIKLHGRGSIGSPTNSLTGNNLSNYVFGDVSSKEALATFRVENTITKNSIPVFGRYGASILAQVGDTMFTLSANPNTPDILVTAGNTTSNILWNKRLAFSESDFSIKATAFYEGSLRKLKENIKPFNKSGVELINSLDIVTFDRIDDKTKNKIGVIADDTSEEFLSEDKDAVDLYKTIFIQAKAIQELEDRLSRLEKLHYGI